MVLRVKEEMWMKHNALDMMNFGIKIEIVLNLKKDKRNRKESHVFEMRKETDKKEEARDLHYY